MSNDTITLPRAVVERLIAALDPSDGGSKFLEDALRVALVQPAQEPLGIVESAVPGAGGFHVRLGKGQVMPKIGTPLYVGIGGKA